MVKGDDLKTALGIITETVSSIWPFDQNHYPLLKGLSEREIRNFGFLHMSLHLAKDAGTLARIQERVHHRRRSLFPKDWQRVKKLAMKAVVSGFRLFILSGGTSEELKKYITKDHRLGGGGG